MLLGSVWMSGRALLASLHLYIYIFLCLAAWAVAVQSGPAQCGTGDCLAEAIASGASNIILTGNIRLSDADWAGLSTPVVLEARNLTVQGSDPHNWFTLDFNSQRDKVRLARGSVLTLMHLVLDNIASEVVMLAVRLDLIAPSPPDDAAGVLAFVACAVIQATCFPFPYNVRNGAGLVRPPQFPGRNRGQFNASQEGCKAMTQAEAEAVGVSAAQICWATRVQLDDVAGAAQRLSPVSGLPIPMHYSSVAFNTSSVCRVLMTVQCIEELGPLLCALTTSGGGVPPPSPAARGAEGGGGSGGTSAGALAGAIVGGVLGGLLLLAAALAAALLWRRRRGRPAAPPAAAPTPSASISLDPESGGGGSQGTPEVAPVHTLSKEAFLLTCSKSTATGGGASLSGGWLPAILEAEGECVQRVAASPRPGPLTGWSGYKDDGSGGGAGTVVVVRPEGNKEGASGESTCRGGHDPTSATDESNVTSAAVVTYSSPLITSLNVSVEVEGAAGREEGGGAGRPQRFCATDAAAAAAATGAAAGGPAAHGAHAAGRGPAGGGSGGGGASASGGTPSAGGVGAGAVGMERPPRPPLSSDGPAAAAPPPPPPAPDVVRLLPNGLLGKGGHGSVLRGVYCGVPVAVKLVSEAGSAESNAEAQRAFVAEVSVLGRCRHPNVVRLLAACVTPPRFCLVMELMEVSLERVLHGTPGAPLLPLDKVLHIGLQVARGLEYLHPTVTHRDLKPSNVLLNRPGDPRPDVKLSDFGLSRLRSTVASTISPEAGTPQYLAPECYDPANCRISHKVDIFAVATLLWEMLTGQRPWKDYTAVGIAVAMVLKKVRLPLWGLGPARCPPRLRELLGACWEADPQRRPAAAEVVKLLLLVQEDLRTGTPEPTPLLAGSPPHAGPPGGAASGPRGGDPHPAAAPHPPADAPSLTPGCKPVLGGGPNAPGAPPPAGSALQVAHGSPEGGAAAAGTSAHPGGHTWPPGVHDAAMAAAAVQDGAHGPAAGATPWGAAAGRAGAGGGVVEPPGQERVSLATPHWEAGLGLDASTPGPLVHGPLAQGLLAQGPLVHGPSPVHGMSVVSLTGSYLETAFRLLDSWPDGGPEWLHGQQGGEQGGEQGSSVVPSGLLAEAVEAVAAGAAGAGPAGVGVAEAEAAVAAGRAEQRGC